MTLFTIETKYAVAFLPAFYIIFSQSATIIAIQVYLYVEVGKVFLVLTVTIIIEMVVLFFLYKALAQLELDKLDYFHRRAALNIELIESMKSLNQLGWERLMRVRNKELRAK